MKKLFLANLLYFLYWVVQAQTPQQLPMYQPITQYVQNLWNKDVGLPSNNINDLFQSSEGYIWATSYNGIIRFDGVRFTLFDKENLELLKTNPCELLFELKDKTLLITTETSGVLQYKQNIFSVFIPHQSLGSLVNTIAQTPTGALWLGTQRNGIFYYENGKLTKPLENFLPLKGLNIKALCIDSLNNLWIGTDDGLFVSTEKGVVTPHSNSPSLLSNNIHFLKHHNNTVWIGTTQGLCYGNIQTIQALPPTTNFPTRSIYFDKQGNLCWIATQKGLFRYHIDTQQIELFDNKKGLNTSDFRDVFIDHEGSLWCVLYRQGILRFKHSNFENYTEKDGIPAGSANTICQIDDTTYLIGTDVGKIFQLRQQKITPYVLKTPLPTDKRIKRIFQDSKKNIWICSYNGLIKITPTGKEIIYNELNGLNATQIRVITETSKGVIWVGTREAGIFKMVDENRFVSIGGKKDFSSTFIMSIDEDNYGNIWIGTNDAGVLVTDSNGNVLRKYDTQNGLLSNLIFNISFDYLGNTWLLGNTGITILEKDNQHILHLTTKNSGLPDESIFDVIFDTNRQIWCSSNKGLIMANFDEVMEFLRQKTMYITYTLYDKQDGLSSSECTGASLLLQGVDGKLFIPTLGGISMLDTKKIIKNSSIPPIKIESIVADDKVYLPISTVTLPAGTQRVTVYYTGLSFLSPQKNQYKFRLDNLDKEWLSDTEQAGKAIYTNLAPATYTFRVIGSNNDGVWNNTGASITIVVQPFFYQTWWFRILVVLSIGAIIVAFYYYQLNRVKKRNQELETEVANRTAKIRIQNQEILAKTQEVLAHQNEVLAHQEEIQEKNKRLEQLLDNVTSSIQYAKRIQEAMLPTEQNIQEIFPDSFIFYVPRDIVSGDFYWFQQLHIQGVEGNVSLQNKFIIAVADCTGHGVPGAFMSMAGQVFLNQIVNIQGIIKPNLILNELHKDIRKALKQEYGDNRDGMDIALCKINYDSQTILFAGAKSPLFLVQDDDDANSTATLIEADKMPIGGAWGKENDQRTFSLKTIALKAKGTNTIYMFSDGYHDQFGGTDNKRFSSKRLRETLLSISTMTPNGQKEYLKATFESWKGTKTQLDDVLVLGIKI